MRRLLLLAALLASSTPVMAQEKITFAVIPFQSQQSFGLDQQSLAALGGGIAQILATELSLSPGGTATPRNATSQAITSQQLPKADRIDAETAAKVGAMVGARYVIMGNFVDYYGKFRLNARVIEVATGSIVNRIRGTAIHRAGSRLS